MLDVSESDAYESPELTADSEEIVNEQKELAKILEMTITYEIDQVSWKLTSKEYGDWISNSLTHLSSGYYVACRQCF